MGKSGHVANLGDELGTVILPTPYAHDNPAFWERGSKCIHPAELFDMGRGKIELLDTLLDQKL